MAHTLATVFVPLPVIGPAGVFEENLRIARGFLRLQFYIEDFATGRNAGVGRAVEIVTELLEDVGVVKLVKNATAKASKELDARDKEQFFKQIEAGFVNWFDRHEREITTFARDVVDVKAAYERGLALHSIVVVMAGFEDYTQTVTREEIERSPEIESRFQKELEAKFRYANIAGSFGDTRKAFGEVVAASFSFSNPEGVLAHLQKLTASRLTDDPRRWVAQFQIYQAHRNLAAHRAGIVDAQFKAATGSPDSVGQPVKISQDFAKGALSFFEKTVTAIQAAVDSQRIGDSAH